MPFLLGIYGIDQTEEAVKVIQETSAAGIVLLRRNIESAAQVRELVGDLEAALGFRLLVALEHEGGAGYRFTRSISFQPGNLALAKAGSNSLAYETGKVLAQELGFMGVNINFAPVLDVSADADMPDLNLRTFGMSPAVASAMGAEMIRGMQEWGVAATARHFPGRGSGAGKPGEIPTVAKSGDSILEQDLAPFQVAIAGGVDLIMSALAIYPEVDPQVPAVFSRRIVTELLRDEMGFKGVVVSEDLTSPSVLSTVSAEEAAVRALLAGNDLLVLAHDPDVQRKAFRGVKAALESNRIPKDAFLKSQERLKALVRKKQSSAARVFSQDEDGGGTSLAAMVASQAVKIEADPQKLLPLAKGQRAGILVPRLWDVADRIVIDEEIRGAAALVQGWAQAHSASCDVLEIPIQPGGDMLDLTFEWAAGMDVVVHFCFDAHRFPGQRKLLEQLQARCPKVVAVLIGNPRDRLFAGASTTVVNTFGFRVSQIAAGVNVLFKPAR